ncbi:MAG: NAD(P)/FAD-dependent oxidoreductase [Candidatus Omnitrophota bacterium]
MESNQDIFDIAVLGAGAAGAMAAIRAAGLSKRTVLIERNNVIGKKIMLTGNGRCNITNTAGIEKFIEAFENQGRFLRTAFWAFSNHDLIKFFEANGIAMKVEEQGRVFPAVGGANSIVKVLGRCLAKNKVTLLRGTRLIDIKKVNGFFQLSMADKTKIKAQKVILATGGASYKNTGSSGDGFCWAKKLGHSVTPLKPALVPLKVKETWIKHLQGLCLSQSCISFFSGKKIVSDKGGIIFTHFGLSGPLILDLSARIVSAFNERGEIPLFIDLEPDSNPEQIKNKLLKEFNAAEKSQLKTIMKKILQQRLVPVFLSIAGVAADKIVSQISRQERHKIISSLKALPLTIIGSLPIEEAMVTNGGVSLKEINPRTMESKIIAGLYFAGEIIDTCAKSGGYNLQQAFSTGYLAGQSAAQDY